MSLPMKNIILSPKSSLTPTFLREILSPKFRRETGREKKGMNVSKCEVRKLSAPSPHQQAQNVLKCEQFPHQ
jgi:hypothetical protein